MSGLVRDRRASSKLVLKKRTMRDIISLNLLTALVLLLPVSCSNISKEVLDEVRRPSLKEFLLGPEDVIEITVWRNQDLSRIAIVRPDGMVSLPLIGDVLASGLTAAQVADKVAKRLVEFKENPTVSVSIKEVNSYIIYVIGEVTKPGKYPLKSYATVLQGISIAGGFTPYASRDATSVIRRVRDGSTGEREVRIPVPYRNIVAGKGEVGNFTLMSGDTIVVP